MKGFQNLLGHVDYLNPSIDGDSAAAVSAAPFRGGEGREGGKRRKERKDIGKEKINQIKSTVP